MGKFMSGMTAGAIVGAAVGTVIISQMDRKTQRMIRRTGKKMINSMNGTYDGILNWMK